MVEGRLDDLTAVVLPDTIGLIVFHSDVGLSTEQVHIIASVGPVLHLNGAALLVEGVVGEVQGAGRVEDAAKSPRDATSVVDDDAEVGDVGGVIDGLGATRTQGSHRGHTGGC